MSDGLLGIGDLARASGLSVSALRFYDRAGVLPPASVDPVTGYRRYTAAQVRPARVVAALRAVAMPLAEITRVLAGPPEAAAALLDAHLLRLETGLADARRELARVRALVEPAPEATAVTVAAADLAGAIDAVRFAAGTDPALPVLTGVLVELSAGGVRLVATDRYRLAVAVAPARAGAGREPGVRAVAPAAWVDEVRAAIVDAGPVTLTVDGDRLRMRAGGREVTGTALPHDFPDYRRLLPGTATHRVPLDVPALRADLARATAPAVLSLGSDGRLGVGPSTTPAGGVARVGVNPTFLLEALAAAGDRPVVLELDGPVTPLTLRATGADAFSLLMPVALP